MAPVPNSINYLQALFERAEHIPMSGLKQWSPFRIDALGLVTLLGAEEVNKTIGTLRKRRYTDWLPLLAAFVVAGDHFTEERPGYSMYNITDGVHTTELKGWFTRWLSVQDIRNATTIFHWSVRPKQRSSLWDESLAPTLGLLTVAPLLAFTCLIGDWFGFGNSLAIIASVLVRRVMLWQRRKALDAAVTRKEPSRLPFHTTPSEKQGPSVDIDAKQLHRETSQPSIDSPVTLLVTRADGKLVTIYAPRSVLFTFVRDAPLPSPPLYNLARWVGWTAFGAHIILVGMSSLFTQIYTVVILVLSTWLLCHGLAADIGTELSEHVAMDGTTSDVISSTVTPCLSVNQENPASLNLQGHEVARRMHAYVRLQTTEAQDDMLRHWSLLPFKGVPWYDDYETAKVQYEQQVQAKSAPRGNRSPWSAQTPA